jgi:hypothetical protein
LLFGSEFPSSRPPEDFHLQVTSRFGFPYRFPNNVHHARRFAPCPAHGPPSSSSAFRDRRNLSDDAQMKAAPCGR